MSPKDDETLFYDTPLEDPTPLEEPSDDTRDWEDQKQIQEQLCDSAASLLGYDVVRWGHVGMGNAGSCFVGYNLHPKTEPVLVAWDLAELDVIVNKERQHQKQLKREENERTDSTQGCY